MTGRDVGKFLSKMHEDGLGADFVYSEVDAALRTRTFALATRGSLEGGFGLVGVEAQVDFDTTNLTSGELPLRARWGG
jgi:hypothetical protein